MMEAETEREQKKENQRMRFPFVSLLMAGTSIGIYQCWLNWNNLRSQRAFVFSETNFLKNKNYHSMILQPISFESEFFFYGNVPGLFYAGMLVERHLGMRLLVGAYLANCVLSAATSMIY